MRKRFPKAEEIARKHERYWRHKIDYDQTLYDGFHSDFEEEAC